MPSRRAISSSVSMPCSRNRVKRLFNPYSIVNRAIIRPPKRLPYPDTTPRAFRMLAIVLLRLVKRTQLAVPIDLQRIGDQPVVRVHAQVATLSELRLVARPFDLLAAQSVYVVESRLQFLLDCERHIDGDRCHDLEQ